MIPNNGRLSGGNTVTILGDNLDPTGSSISSVTLAGVAASVVRSNRTAIVVQTGASSSPTIGAVIVTTPCFAQTVSTMTFTYNARMLLYFNIYRFLWNSWNNFIGDPYIWSIARL